MKKRNVHFGWLVLAATFYLNLIVDGYCFVFGILKLEIEKDYPDYAPWTISAIVGVVRTIYLTFAPICIAINEIVGPTRVVVFSSVLSAVSFVMVWVNGFINAGFYFDLLMLGVFQGISSALLYGPSIAVVARYFPPHQRALAAGITTCGSPVGAIFYSLIMPPLFHMYGWRGTMTVFAGISLNGIICAMAFLERLKPKNYFEYSKAFEATKDSSEPPKRSNFMRRYFDVKLLCQPSFVCLLAAAVFSIVGYYVPMLLVPKQARHEEFGVTPIVQQNLVLIFGVFNAVGRVVSGRLADFGQSCVLLTSYSIFITGLTVSGLALLAFSQLMVLGNASFITFVVVYGFCIAPLVSMRSVIVCDLYGPKNASATFGWFLSIQGLVQLVGFVLPTWLDSIAPLYAYVFGAVCFLVSAVFVGITFKAYFKAREVNKML